MSTSPHSVAAADRPRGVTISYWIWIACAALLLFCGVMALTASSDGMRSSLADRALAVLSVLFAFLLIVAVTVGVAYFGLVLVAILLLVAPILVYRPVCNGWFTRA